MSVCVHMFVYVYEYMYVCVHVSVWVGGRRRKTPQENNKLWPYANIWSDQLHLAIHTPTQAMIYFSPECFVTNLFDPDTCWVLSMSACFLCAKHLSEVVWGAQVGHVHVVFLLQTSKGVHPCALCADTCQWKHNRWVLKDFMIVNLVHTDQQVIKWQHTNILKSYYMQKHAWTNTYTYNTHINPQTHMHILANASTYTHKQQKD